MHSKGRGHTGDLSGCRAWLKCWKVVLHARQLDGQGGRLQLFFCLRLVSHLPRVLRPQEERRAARPPASGCARRPRPSARASTRGRPRCVPTPAAHRTCPAASLLMWSCAASRLLSAAQVLPPDVGGRRERRLGATRSVEYEPDGAEGGCCRRWGCAGRLFLRSTCGPARLADLCERGSSTHLHVQT